MWIPGCSTGEEVYTLAIILLEQLEALEERRQMSRIAAPDEGRARVDGEEEESTNRWIRDRPSSAQIAVPFHQRKPIQIIATDVDVKALEKAKLGLYSESIAAQVSPERLRKFFVRVPGGFKVSRQLRDMVLFSAHDVCSQPPFHRIDLVSCRNLLIYFTQATRDQVLSNFRFSLGGNGGVLVLGTSEGLGSIGENMFAQLHPSLKVYRSIVGKAAARVPFGSSSQAMVPRSATTGYDIPFAGGDIVSFSASAQRSSAAAIVRSEEALRTVSRATDSARHHVAVSSDRRSGTKRLPPKFFANLMSEFADCCITIDSELRVVHSLGVRCDDFVDHSEVWGVPDLLDFLHPHYVDAVLLGVRRIFPDGFEFLSLSDLQNQRLPSTVIQSHTGYTGDAEQIRLRFARQVHADSTILGVIYFSPVYTEGSGSGVAVTTDGDPGSVITHDAESSFQVGDELVWSRERLVTELQTEISGLRERLKEVIAQLEASNEELQAANEELMASNEELQATNEELQSVNEELLTMNTENEMKIDELQQLNTDMNNLLRWTEVGVAFLDLEGALRRFTSLLGSIIQARETDLGRSIMDFSEQFENFAVMDDIRLMIRTSRPVSRDVLHKPTQLWYRVKVTPYTQDNKVDGAVLMFSDVTAAKMQEFERQATKEAAFQQLSRELQREQWAMEAIVSTCQDAIMIVQLPTSFIYGLQRTAFDRSMTAAGDATPAAVGGGEAEAAGDDLLGVITFASASCAALTGYSCSEILQIGNLGHFICADDHAKFVRSLESIFGKTVNNTRVRVRSRAHEWCWTEQSVGLVERTVARGEVVAVTPPPDTAALVLGSPADAAAASAGPSHCHVVLVFRDISAMMQAKVQDSVRQQREVEKNTAALSEYVASDLRTPISSFQMGCELLRSSGLNTTQLNQLLTLENATELLTHTVNNILTHSRLAAGKELQAEPKSVCVRQLVSKVIGIIHSSPHAEGVDVAARVSSAIASAIMTSESWLLHILVNLMSHALKFTTEGSVQLTMKLVSSSELPETAGDTTDTDGVCSEVEDGALTKLLVEVSDTGTGFESMLMSDETQPLQQLQSNRGGLALGLFSVRKQVSTLGGTCGVRVNTDADPGCVFWFWLPYIPVITDADEPTDIGDSEQVLEILDVPRSGALPSLTTITPLPSTPTAADEAKQDERVVPLGATPPQ